MEDKNFSFKIEDEDLAYKRLDLFLVSALKKLDEVVSRQQIKNLFKQEMMYAKDCKLELKKMPRTGTIVEVIIPAPRAAKAIAEDLPLDIMFEDEHLLIINKAAGMVTHPAPGNYTGTLVNAVLFHCHDLQGVGNELRPGIVHRLDKGTSGIMVVAKTQETHNGLTKLFSTHQLTRKYEALVMGIKNQVAGELNSSIGRNPNNRLKMAIHVPNSKHAHTYYKVLEEFETLSHFELKLETGRTHQIRVHLTSLLKRPVFMDTLYGNPKQDLQRVSESICNIAQNYQYPFLHAKQLGFIHPITKEELDFTIQPPLIFQQVLDEARTAL